VRLLLPGATRGWLREDGDDKQASLVSCLREREEGEGDAGGLGLAGRE